MTTTNQVAIQVLANRSLLTSITAFFTGISYSAHLVKQQLVCASATYTDGAVSPEDAVLWQNAICAGDWTTLNAFHTLSQVPMLEKRLVAVLSGILSYAISHTKDLALLDWIDDSFDAKVYNSMATEADDRALGEQGDLDIVLWAIGRGYELYDGTLDGAASKGHMEIVRFLHESANFDVACKEALLREAAHADQCVDVVAFVLDNVPECSHHVQVVETHDALVFAAELGALGAVKLLLERRSTSCTVNVMDAAAKNGHLELVEYLHENRQEGCTTKAMDEAAANGHLEIVQYLHTHRTEGCTTAAIDGAATNGHLEIVRFLVENRQEGCTTKTMDQAATNGHLNVVQFLHENRQEGCTTEAMDGAATNGHLEIVRFLHENRQEGCTGEAIDQAAKNRHLNVVRFLCNERQMRCRHYAMTHAVMNSDYDMLTFVCENRGEGSVEEVLAFAAERGNLECVKFLFETSSLSQGFELRSWEGLVNVAATNGFLDLIQFFHAHKFFRFTAKTMHNAAISNHLEIVKFLHENRTEG